MVKVKGEGGGSESDMLYRHPRGGWLFVFLHLCLCVSMHVTKTELEKLFANLSTWPCMGEAETLGAVRAAYRMSNRLAKQLSSHPGEEDSMGSQWESQRATPVTT